MTLGLLDAADLALWSLLGLLFASLACYGIRAARRGPPYYRAWIAYAFGMLLAFVVLRLIYEVEHRPEGSEPIYGYAGMGLMAAGLIAGLIWCRQRTLTNVR